MITKKIYKKLYSLFFKALYGWRFKKFGKSSRIYLPLNVEGMSNISIGNNVIIQEHTWLAALPLTGEKVNLSIGAGSVIGHFNHIYATSGITIGKRVLTADKVYISDNLHSYFNIEIPIIDQAIIQKKEVLIGDGTWIGENVCIIGARIGKNCVIGANAVVTHDIPDYSVVVGIPGKIIKRFDISDQKWKNTDSIGQFILKETGK